MTFSWRQRRNNKGSKGMELRIPTHFRCPISLDLMRDPVTLSTGITYDRESIEKWIDAGNRTCPVTNQTLRNLDQIPNHSIRTMIQDWCVENKSFGVERIPTPRIPITPYDVSQIRSKMETAARNGDVRKCGELVEKVKNLAKESERNKRCIVGNGVGDSLADMFEFFAAISRESNVVDLQKQILSALTWCFPIDRRGISKLKCDVSLRRTASFLRCEDDLSSSQNAIFVLKEIVYADQQSIKTLIEIEGIEDTLFQLVKLPICPRSTKSTLAVIHHMMSSSSSPALKFIQLGVIPQVLEILIDGDKSLCEKALAVLDSACDWKEGRESAYGEALTIPLLVKKILRASAAATEIAISALSKLCLGENENAISEAVQFGAFQKLMVVLQVDCGERTKEKVTELLKSINRRRDQLDCFDSSLRFRYIQGSNDL